MIGKGTLSHTTRQSLFVLCGYFLLLLLLINLGTSNLPNLPIVFYLKERLNLGPQQIAFFNLASGFPFAFGGLLGFLRDRWQPFGARARGYLLLVPPIAAALLLWLASSPLTYWRMLIAMVGCNLCAVMLTAEAQGLIARAAHGIGGAGRLGVVLNISAGIPNVVGLLAGGSLNRIIGARKTLMLSAFLVLPVIPFAFFAPRSLQDNTRDNPLTTAKFVGGETGIPLRLLLQHRPLYLPAMVFFLWNFSPGMGTPLFFHLTDTLQLSSLRFAVILSTIAVANMIFSLLYGWFCTRIRLRRLLWFAPILGIVTMPLLATAPDTRAVIIVAFLYGAGAGIASGVFNDLLLRSCPKGWEGTITAFAGASSALALAASDQFGAWLYVRGGFQAALIVSALATALILTLIPAIPHRLTTPLEGEPLPDIF